MKTYSGIVKFLLLLMLPVVCQHVSAQTIRYSKTFHIPIFDRMKLVANIGGNHHMLFFRQNNFPEIYIINAGLQFVGKKELPLKLSQSYDIRVIPFKNHYYVYLHQPGSARHALWTINTKGDPTDLSSGFQHFVDATFTKNTSTLQLINQSESLVVVANVYYDKLKEVVSTVIQLDHNFDTVNQRELAFPFDRMNDVIKQITLAGNNIFLMKSTRKEDAYVIDLAKGDLNTGTILQQTYASNTKPDSEPAFVYNAADSSSMIYANIRSKVMVVKLDHEFNEIHPVKLLQVRFNKNIATNFLHLADKSGKWLAIKKPFDASSHSQPNYWVGENRYSTRGLQQNDYPPNQYIPYNRYNNRQVIDPDNAVRIALYNSSYHLTKDSVVGHKTNQGNLSAREYATVYLKNKSGILFKQNFTPRKKGLLLVSVNNNGQLSAEDITVFENYEYSLSNLQMLDQEQFILPYITRTEMGLVKISFTGERE